MNIKKLLFLAAICGIVVYGCKKVDSDISESSLKGKGSATTSATTTEGLKNAFINYFKVGAAIGMDEYGRTDEKTLFAHEFNSFTPNNNLKWVSIEKVYNNFTWTSIDTLVKFAISKGMVIRGHTLVWREPKALPKYTDQLFGWTTYDSISPGVFRKVTRAKFFAQLKNHITKTMQHFGNKIYCWDVVNEAIAEDAQADTNMYKTWRGIDFYAVCKQGGQQGSDYIDSAYKYAQAANPSAFLFYNEYGLEDKPKRDRVISMIDRLRSQGRKIHGIGIQAHWWADYPTKPQILEMLAAFKAKNLIIHISEIDVSMYNKGEVPTNFDYTPARRLAQETRYREMFSAFRQYNDAISSVTFFNLTDRKHGRSTWDRPDSLLLFDMYGQKKPVYDKIIQDIP